MACGEVAAAPPAGRPLPKWACPTDAQWGASFGGRGRRRRPALNGRSVAVPPGLFTTGELRLDGGLAGLAAAAAAPQPPPTAGRSRVFDTDGSAVDMADPLLVVGPWRWYGTAAVARHVWTIPRVADRDAGGAGGGGLWARPPTATPCSSPAARMWQAHDVPMCRSITPMPRRA